MNQMSGGLIQGKSVYKLNVTPTERVRLGRYPTPIQHLTRLSEQFGVQLYIKRDDLNETVLSGNKLRKLEFLVADAQATGADALLTFGNVHSNHCRITAGVAAGVGLGCELFLSGPRPDVHDGNTLLDYLFGASLHFAESATDADRETFADELSRRYAAEGRQLYVIPIGATNTLGTWGYVDCMHEINLQQQQLSLRFDRIVCSAGSGGTLAGLLAGKQVYGLSADLLGVFIGAGEEYAPMRERTAACMAGFARRFVPDLVVPSTDQIPTTEAYRGIDYAVNTKEEIETLLLVARQEGIMLDTVYTLKAFHGMLGEIRAGRIAKGETVLFIHTGGVFGIFPRKEHILALCEELGS